MSNYGRLAPHLSHHKHKLIGRVINSVSVTTPEYLRWCECSITFNRTVHPYSIPKPGRFPLIIDPLVGTTWLTTDLMYGGQWPESHVPRHIQRIGGLNPIRLTLDKLLSSTHPFYGVVPGKHSVPLGWVTLPVTFGDATNYRTEMLMLCPPWMGHPADHLRPATSSLWSSPVMHTSSLRFPGSLGSSLLWLRHSKRWTVSKVASG
jgi:hypothetical protein